MITIILADDHPTTRAGLHTILEAVSDIQIVGEAQDGFEAMKLVERFQPKILLLDLKMPGPRPAEIEKWVRTNYPNTITLILTGHDRDYYLSSMMKAGVAGYLNKNEPSERLIEAIHKAANGEKVFTTEQYIRAQNWRDQAGEKYESLTERERQIIHALLKGFDNATIASSLDVTAKTIASHINSILGKLEVNSRLEAVTWVHNYLSDDLE